MPLESRLTRAAFATLACAAAFGAGALAAPPAGAKSHEKHAAKAGPNRNASPWSNAKVGSKITYRIADPFAMPGKPHRTAVVTEEVTELTEQAVKVRTTRREDGKPDETGSDAYPRRMSAAQLEKFQESIGAGAGKPVTKTLAGAALKCELHTLVEKGRTKGRGLTSTATICKDVPGWVVERSAHRESEAAPFVWFELLDFKR